MQALLFKDYLKEHKRNFDMHQFETDIHYRAVMFQQYSRRYRMFVERNDLANDYIKIAYEIRAYEKRLREYRSNH